MCVAICGKGSACTRWLDGEGALRNYAQLCAPLDACAQIEFRPPGEAARDKKETTGYWMKRLPADR